jgi:diguanylate cyclase (GGDEF)-like protein
VTDPLTGLYNRRHFDTQLDVILTDRLAKNQSVCLLIIDLDGFKFINDTYGHPSGDEALRAIAGLLKRMVRRNDYIARLAGDEFAMVLKDTTLDDATHIANKVHAAISETHVKLPIGHVQLQCSIGVAAAPTHGQKAQELVSAADVALYQSKRRGRNRVEVLSPDISKALMSIFSQGFQLRHALEQGNLMPAFQPICDIATGEPIAYEALARMQHGGATIKAGDFITVAEELGLTREIDLHIIEQALALAPMGYGLFLNLDPSSFNDRAFVTQLGELIGPACAAGRSITIEITERENVTITDTLVDRHPEPAQARLQAGAGRFRQRLLHLPFSEPVPPRVPQDRGRLRARHAQQRVRPQDRRPHPRARQLLRHRDHRRERRERGDAQGAARHGHPQRPGLAPRPPALVRRARLAQRLTGPRRPPRLAASFRCSAGTVVPPE